MSTSGISNTSPAKKKKKHDPYHSNFKMSDISDLFLNVCGQSPRTSLSRFEVSKNTFGRAKDIVEHMLDNKLTGSHCSEIF